VDPWFLVEAAPDLTPLIFTSRQVNDAQPHFVLALVRRALGEDLHGKRIAALGMSFKPDVDDLRESPAVETAHLLQKAGAVVKAFEPNKPDADLPGLTLVSSLEEAVKDADALVLLVGHTPFKALDPQQIAQLTPARTLIDTVNGWNTPIWKNAGFRMFTLGVGKER
jgi:UDP-N-acetyl-D-mannosaminuronic acid dehydrogenase